MQLSIADAKFILEAPKRLVDIRPWRSADNRHGCSVVHNFAARISIEGTLPRGLWFRCSKIWDFPLTGTFQLDCEQQGTRQHLPLYRLDWRPFGGHKNGPHGPEELRDIYLPEGVTHEHTCLFHSDERSGLILSGGVQTARPISPDFESFHEALRRACDRLSIRNHGEIPPPISQGELL